MSSNFRYQTFVAVSGNLGGKVPVVEDVLSSHEQETYPSTSFDENCIEFEFQTHRNYDVQLRQTYLALKLKLVSSRGYETYNSKEVKKAHKEEIKAEEEETAEGDAPGPLISHVNNILNSIFSNVEVYVNNQQIMELQILDKTMETPLPEPFFTRRMKMLSKPESFMLYGRLGDNFFSTFELFYPIIEN